MLFNHEYPRRLRACAIGAGGHALRNVFPAFQYAPVDLVAVCDLDEDRASAAARSFGGGRVYTETSRMLAEERPEVIFAVLNYDERGRPRYPAVAIEAMRAGAHVWIEKPPASSFDEAIEMKVVSRQTGCFVGVGFKKMFAPANVKAAEIIARPEFGAVSTLTVRYPQSLPPPEDREDDRKMQGFLDHMVHPYSVLRLLGGPIAGLSIVWQEGAGGSFATIRFVSGALGCLHLVGGGSAMAPLERTEVVGEYASVVVDNNLRVTYYRPSPPPGPYGRTPSFYGNDDSAPLVWEPEFSLGQLYNKGLFLLGYVPEIAAFCASVLEGRPPAKGNLDDALQLMKVYEAYRRQGGLRIPMPTD